MRLMHSKLESEARPDREEPEKLRLFQSKALLTTNFLQAQLLGPVPCAAP